MLSFSTPVPSGTDIPPSFPTPVCTSRTGSHSFSTPTHFASSKCHRSRVTALCHKQLSCSSIPVHSGTDIPPSSSTPTRTIRTRPHSSSTPTHFATSKCHRSRVPCEVEQTYPRRSRLPCAPAELDPTGSRLPRTLPQATIVFLKSRAKWNRHTPVCPDSRAHRQNWTPLVLDAHTLCH